MPRYTTVLNMLRPIRSVFVRGHVLDDDLEIIDAAIGELRDGGGGGLSEADVQTLIDTSLAALVSSAPSALNTLDELAAALGDDANFAATVTTALAAKLAKAANLSDLANAATARTNLGLGTAALAAAGDFDTAGAAAAAQAAALAGSARLLDRVSYDPGSVTTVSTTSTTAADVDATHAKVAFTFPANGIVRIVAAAMSGYSNGGGGTAGDDLIWCLRDGNAVVSGTERDMYSQNIATGTSAFAQHAYVATVAGTPGDSKTWKLAHYLAGGVAGITGKTIFGSIVGPLMMEAWAINL